MTRLAKWKTALQLVAIGFLLAGTAGDLVVADAIDFSFPIVTYSGLTLLWLSALLTLYTGYDYFRAGLHHLTQD